MIFQNIALYNFNNGALMMILFAFVCLALIAVPFLFIMGGGKKSDKKEDES